MEEKTKESLLALKKIEFVKKKMDEQSLDTIKEWYSMYDEARYVSSLYSQEEDLKEYHVKFEEDIKKGFIRHKQDLLYNINMTTLFCVKDIPHNSSTICEGFSI